MPLGSTVQGCVCYLKGYYIVAFLFLCKGEAHGLLNKEGDAHKPLTRNPKESVYLHSRLSYSCFRETLLDLILLFSSLCI